MPNWIGLTFPGGAPVLLDAEMVTMIHPAEKTLEVNGPKSVVYWGNTNIKVLETVAQVAHLCGVDMGKVRIVKPEVPEGYTPKPGEEMTSSNGKPFLRLQ